MQRALDLAAKGMGNVAPNPMVGCVVVHNREIIGEGFHERFGEPHAEVNAVAEVKDKNLLPASTLYVTLEPCSHYGKTPPCADMILANKIPRVVIAMADPNPVVSGSGVRRLQGAGVEVVAGVMEKEARFLNRRFVTFHELERPYIILKWAQSEEGFMALSEPKQFWFSGEESKVLSHQWRTEEQAILVGKRTVEIDDCELTARLWPGKNPLRLVIDRNLELDGSRKIFNQRAKTIVFNEKESSTNGHVELVKLNFSESVIPQIITWLHEHQILSVIIEGGADTLQRFVDLHLWDEARIVKTNSTLGEGIPAPIVKGDIAEVLKSGQDEVSFIYNNHL